MLYRFTAKDLFWDCDIHYEQNHISLDNDRIRSLWKYLKDNIDLAIPLDTIDFDRISGVNYKFKLKLVDNRTWEQDVIFDIISDPKLSHYQTTSLYRLSEIDLIKQLRSLLIELYPTYIFTKISLRKL